MTFLAAFAVGVGLGLAVAMPVGPMALLCMQRTLANGFAAGAAAGAGVALADSAYAAIAAFGLSAITSFLVNMRTPLQVVGLAAMLWLAWRIWRTAEAPKPAGSSPPSGGTTAVQMFLLTLANPMTMVTFLALFVGAGAGLAQGYGYSAALTAGVLAGSLAWWLALSGIVSAVRSRLTDRAIAMINRFSALIIAGLGLWKGAGLIT